MAKRTSIPQAPKPQLPPLPASPEDAGQQLGMPTSTDPFPDRSAAAKVAADMLMSHSSPGGTTNLPVLAAVQTPAPLPGVRASKAKTIKKGK
jgi:hypothetical protein